MKMEIKLDVVIFQEKLINLFQFKKEKFIHFLKEILKQKDFLLDHNLKMKYIQNKCKFNSQVLYHVLNGKIINFNGNYLILLKFKIFLNIMIIIKKSKQLE